jgi:hypothetical protein
MPLANFRSDQEVKARFACQGLISWRYFKRTLAIRAEGILLCKCEGTVTIPNDRTVLLRIVDESWISPSSAEDHLKFDVPQCTSGM